VCRPPPPAPVLPKEAVVDEAVCPSFITASQRTQGRIASELADLRKYTGASKPALC
jgi:hypothetical protein